MKTEFVDVTDTRKNLVVEIPSAVVDAEIERVARDYSKAARIPGFRPGKVPARVVKQRFRDQILHDVAHGLIPRVVDEALRERGLEPIDTPDIRDVLVEEGQPMKFTASFETVPPIEPGDYGSITLRRPKVAVDDPAVEQVEDRGVQRGDTVVIDLERRAAATAEGSAQSDRHENVSIEIGAPANPPGFDQELMGMPAGSSKSFTIRYPADYAVKELAGTEVGYAVTVKALKKRVIPQLDDEFAKDVGEFETLDQLRQLVRQDLLNETAKTAERDLRGSLLKQLAKQVSFDIPAALVDREIDRRVEEFARRLVEQQIDPRKTNIDWDAFREAQREPAREAVGSALVLDEVARREHLNVSEQDIERELNKYAERTGRTAAAVRARLEKEGGISRLNAGLRREKAVDFLLARATIMDE
jgi:trigger factor